jgi:hypothetical protein
MNKNGKKIIYVTRDIERALGAEPDENFIILSNDTKYGRLIKNKFPDFVHLIKSETNELLGTTELIAHPQSRAILEPNSSILVFKNTQRVESEISSKGLIAINPKSALSERVENKLSQIRWLGELAKYLPPHTIKLAKLINWKNMPFIIQWAHGHTGDGTILIKDRENLDAIQAKFPERMARLTNFIEGPSFTVNAVVSKDKILMANISYQITGLQPFTDNEFSTIGNDWAYAKKFLNENDLNQIRTIVRDVGSQLQRDGWKGLFGLDFIMDKNSRKIYLIEINARQPASTTFESQLEILQRDKGTKGITTFEAHIRALLDLPIDQDIIAIDNGAQIVQRITKHIQGVFDEITTKLEQKGFEALIYENTDPNLDLVRIQTDESLIQSHNTLNKKGQEIVEIIKGAKINLEV